MGDIQKEAQKVETTVFLQNLVKLIPVEIIALFAVVKGLIPADAAAMSVWVVFGVLAALVPFYVIFSMKIKEWDQVVLMTFAFPIWAVAIGGLPSLGVDVAWLAPWMLSVALALFTLIPPMFYGKRVEIEQARPAVKPELAPVMESSMKSARSWRAIVR